MSLAGELYCQQILANNPFSPGGTFSGGGLKQEGMESANVLARGDLGNLLVQLCMSQVTKPRLAGHRELVKKGFAQCHTAC